MKDAYWFKHDSNARHDPDILMLRAKYKGEGYGLYWMLIEALREADGYRLPHKHLLALCFDFASDLLTPLLDDCINEFNLITSDGEYFWSESLKARMDRHEEIKSNRAVAGRKGGQSKANPKQKPSKTEANPKQVLGKPQAIERDPREREREEEHESGKVCSNGHRYTGSFCRQCTLDSRDSEEVADES